MSHPCPRHRGHRRGWSFSCQPPPDATEVWSTRPGKVSVANKSFYSLGTDGFGRSDTRKNLRKFFEVDKEHLVAYSLSVLAKEQLIASKYAKDAIKKYNIDGEKPMPTKL